MRETMTGLSVAVIGGGIGGTSAALSLLHSGVDVQAYEQAKELREVGAGIQISPNASRVLHRLGLAEALAEMGVKPLGGINAVGRTVVRCCALRWRRPWRARSIIGSDQVAE